MWVDDNFFYTPGLLKAIGKSYLKIYDGLPRLGWELTNPQELAELIADFDMALSSLGRKWEFSDGSFSHYRQFSKTQRVVIADILDVGDIELLRHRFYDIPKLRRIAYSGMCRFLNGASTNGG